MKDNLKLFVFIFLLSLLPLRLNAQQELLDLDSEVTISMDVQDAGLKDVLKVLSMQAGLNFIASEAVQDRKITLYLDKVPIKEAMDKIFKANNLTYELDEDANIFIVYDWGKPQIETITKVFYLKYATVSSSSLREEMSAQRSGAGGVGGVAGGGAGQAGAGAGGKWAIEQDAGITKAVKKILSERGSIIEDYRTNSLIVTDMPSRMPLIVQTIASLDIPAPQVMLEVEMLDVSKNMVDKLGFKFGDNPITLIMPGGWARRGMKFYFGAKSDRGKEGGLTLGSTYAHLLDYLRTQTDTKTLARPRLLTLNNEPAEIKITTNEVIGEQLTFDDQGNVSTRTAERTETGVSLRVTPQINLETGEITMFISPKVKEATTSAFSSSYRDPEERGTNSLVRVKDGETIIVGGLIRNEFSQTITKLPILGDIPVLGALFRHKNKTKDKERELLVFITPHIIKDTIEATALKRVSLPEREQSVSPAFQQRKIAINASLNSFEKMMK